MGQSGTIDRKRLLIRLRPFMYGGRGHSLAANLGWSYRVFYDASGSLCSRTSAKRFSEDEPARCIEPCRPTLVAKK